MQLRTFSDLGMRSLLVLGELPDDTRMTISQLSRALNASENHVAKVVAKLADLGVVLAIRGRNGGVSIAPEALDKGVGDLMRQLEGPDEVVDCEGSQECPLVPRDCELRRQLVVAQDAFYDSLNRNTVRSLLERTIPRSALDGPVGPRPIGLPAMPER
ncbi:Rrf2 family transcriptional regulator [Corynebacterium sp. 320]|uniref:RrF2 family transcriptional regulator n=1 Tax=Corynebacterium TaxID=1716 RepID=UPI00125CB191|nr:MULTISPECIES: Rrf2 family transcriptional regulator [Corynebacterium]KAB1503054.1 Rrf2 family transcriptional regulator [Corynebacterium sp. 320]KAB1550735.1 Rrf2 family transcriptional regulator [Corynebacterium sp. 321]KAB1551094.1 Rrf2 family transcriptional regulator [Corynebacterium sp. 319]KAB3526851.1 Rrf2 family transcriptional regulator [Corynebacterium sp. 250]KAB3538344.1 Rrf2 family transcriptional regulator [Corynebacterium sp. 366]